MKVNMTPNPLDVVTIHASQGDTEARQWEFELHNNGELIDTSEITEQMFFKAYKGGTEQILPENTSTPTTSPFLGDIRYPQGLLTDQEFTYRQSPTEEDGLAFVERIKGNTIIKDNTLISFNGTALKTVGKNLLPPSESFSSVPDITISADNGVYTLNGTATAYRQAIATDSFVLEPGTYRFTKKADIVNNNVSVQLRSVDGLTTYATAFNNFGETFTLADRTEIKFRIAVNANAGTLNNYIIRPMLEFGSVATDFEPYTETTTDLPISTYFPTGMKRARNAYDELTNSKASTRVKQIIFDGSSDENWEVIASIKRAYIAVSDIDTSTPDTSVGNIMSNMYVSGAYSRGAVEDIITTRYGIAQINVFDSVNITSSSTTATWKTYLQNHPLIVNYELATPTETSFTTASLVTENTEIPLSNEDGVLIGKCTEELSAEPGFHDAKIKLADGDGECYSNKIQLHIERSPQ